MKSLIKAVVKGLFGLRFKRYNQIYHPYLLAKEVYRLRVSFNHLVKDIFLITLGVLSAGFGLKGFLLPNKFIDGGVTGISLLINFSTGVSLPILLIIINIPFIILGFTQINKIFPIKSIVAIVGLAIAVSLINYPVITSDKLLIAVFGGFFLGAGIGLSVRGGAVLDGTEVLAIFLSKRSGLTIGDIILIFNIMIFSVAMYFLSVETALYAILTYLAASKTVDFIIEGFEEYTGITIISSHSEEIREIIITKLARGVTIYRGKRGFARNDEPLKDIDIVFTVITRLEVGKLKAEIEKIDPSAFIIMSAIKDTKGGMIKKRALRD
ncbi:MAG: YitT family protein [Bacteroidales bacterium]|nr:YitT family protein [Bacteroidales bacterium]